MLFRSSVFKKQTLFGSIVLVLSTLAVVAFLFSTSARDEAQYVDLMSKRTEKTKDSYFGKQIREHVTRDIYFTNVDGQRLMMRLRSKGTELIFDKKRGGQGLVEHIQGLKAMMQEQLYYQLKDGREILCLADGRWVNRLDQSPVTDINWEGVKSKQVVRYLEADNGQFLEKSGEFSGKQVKLFKLSLLGHQCRDTFSCRNPLLEGVCDAVTFSFLNKQLNFSADGVHAVIHKKK